ncbi:hypothetical protein K456DRAFT_1762469 [Colletotrichum gloeosporioides 23]|nr:hypothetical protein K456DRAFT_1762469 [Colletotrichum gloeosporioides 23]
MTSLPQSGILLEAEDFHDYGGWILDSQFDSEMGSPYLLAHGNGKPVADATTVLSTEKGHYHVWVRAKDWVPGHHPGQFTLTINETSWIPFSARTMRTGPGSTQVLWISHTAIQGLCSTT